jgi:hypothetical protein
VAAKRLVSGAIRLDRMIVVRVHATMIASDISFASLARC